VPFLFDIEVHVRFLVVLPLLIVAELVVHRRMRPLLQQFLERNLIPENALTRFEAAIASAFRLRNSVLAEVLLIAFVYGVGILIVWRQYFALDTATWYATPAAGGSQLSLAGMWYGYVSLPIFQFLLCRWYFRLFIWARFLWQVSRIELSLVPTHPDSLGGLSFVSGQVYAFTVLAVAHGALVAGKPGQPYLVPGSRADRLQGRDCRRRHLHVVRGALPTPGFCAAACAGEAHGFARIWRAGRTLRPRIRRQVGPRRSAADEPLLGSADIQSLADMGNSFSVVQNMRIVPIKRDDLLRLVGATLAPVVPLGLTMMSLEDLLKKLMGVLF
jgi:hypothetical protein